MKNTLKRTAIGMLSSLALIGAVKAQDISGNLKYFQTAEKDGTSYPEANVFYGLPGKINGYTYLDVYKDGSYGGQTQVDKTLNGRLSVAGQATHFNEPLTSVGIGLKLDIPVKNGYGNIKVLPAWIDNKGNLIKNKVLLGYAFGKDLGNGFNFETFAEINLDNSRLTWSYGELELTKKIGAVKIGYIPALLPQGKLMPKIEHRLGVRYDWDFAKKSRK